jgi:hypothetical protein
MKQTQVHILPYNLLELDAISALVDKAVSLEGASINSERRH